MDFKQAFSIYKKSSKILELNNWDDSKRSKPGASIVFKNKLRLKLCQAQVQLKLS